MRAIQAGRVLPLGFGLAFLASFASLLRQFVHDWLIAALAAFMLAFSGGLIMESRVVRKKLIAAGFAYGSLLIALIAARQMTDGMRPFMIGIAAFLSILAMLNKVQTIF